MNPIQKLIYGDPDTEGVHVLLRIGYSIAGVPVDIGDFWARPVVECGQVIVDGHDLGYMPVPESGTRGLTQHGLPCEVSTAGIFRVILMQTNPLPPLPVGAEVTMDPADDAAAEDGDCRLARVEFPIASMTVEAGVITDDWRIKVEGDAKAMFVRGYTDRSSV